MKKNISFDYSLEKEFNIRTEKMKMGQKETVVRKAHILFQPLRLQR